MYQWTDYLKAKPDFESHAEYGADIISLDNQSKENSSFSKKCGSSCILLIEVVNNDANMTSNYALQITRDMMELIDNVKVLDAIDEA